MRLVIADQPCTKVDPYYSESLELTGHVGSCVLKVYQSEHECNSAGIAVVSARAGDLNVVSYRLVTFMRLVILPSLNHPTDQWFFF